MNTHVLEIGSNSAAGYCGRLFVLEGFQVTRIDQPKAADLSTANRAQELYLHAGKTRLTLDLDNDSCFSVLENLVKECELLIVDETPARLDQLKLLSLVNSNPQLLIISITPFGLTGPYRNWQAHKSILLGMGGYSHLIGDPDKAPLTVPGFYAEYQAGQYAFVAALASLTARNSDGVSEVRVNEVSVIEVSVLECVQSLSQFTTVMWSCSGAIRGRSGFAWTNIHPIGMYPCKDGWIAINVVPQFWDNFLLMLNKPELAFDERFENSELRLQNQKELDEIIKQCFASSTMDELLISGQEVFRVPTGSLYNMDRALKDEHLAARNFWNVIDSGEGVGIRAPGMAYHYPDEKRSEILVFQNQQEKTSLANNSFIAKENLEGKEALAAQSQEMSQGPLTGIRILDLTHVWAGPLATRILADLGADVIKVESPVIRGALEPAPGLLGLMIDAPEEPFHWNKNPFLNKLNRNKRSICLDLKTQEGKKLFLDLAKNVDVVVENFSAATMNKLGVGFEQLKKVNESLIYLSMPGYGTFGPQSSYVAFGPSVEPMTGLNSLLGYSAAELRPTNVAIPDAAGGVAAASAIVSALYHRREKNKSGAIDFSMQEAMICLLGEYFVEQQLTGIQPAVQGNRDNQCAPQGTYACKGEDDWIVISCTNEQHWQSLCSLAARGWDQNPLLASAEHRLSNHDQLDEQISQWSSQYGKMELMSMLQNHGIPAGAVMTTPDMHNDANNQAREYFRTVPGKNMGSILYPGLPVKFNASREFKWHKAPGLGEHNSEVLKELLGLDNEDVDHLQEQGVLAQQPPA